MPQGMKRKIDELGRLKCLDCPEPNNWHLPEKFTMLVSGSWASYCRTCLSKRNKAYRAPAREKVKKSVAAVDLLLEITRILICCPLCNSAGTRITPDGRVVICDCRLRARAALTDAYTKGALDKTEPSQLD